MTPFWMSAFLDVPAAGHARTAEFWTGVTGTTLSDPRGPDGEFASFVPDDGDVHLRLQRVGDGPPRLHLDVHVEDPRDAADEAAERGAREVADHGFVNMTSPGGLSLCFVSHPASRRSAPRTWPGGHASLVDQVCIDIAPAAYDDELAFWSATTGWPVHDREGRPEFARIGAPAAHPLQLLMQRRDDGDEPTSAHLDLGTSAGGRPVEVARHEALGATVQQVFDGWTVMRDPAGMTYCVTDHAVR
ncbi:VOC family protein [uncultured Nocardioides sp.]|uniref:Glyoxalase-like domain-containing protein n=1 Tax=uncultured Nocardioides sp. TaxID=198441 RepID=A0A6J4NXS2_9ACTN|nr:VOC family protein [uncultured Nocardioides sp.]CAA9398346.1 MAG: hypothetical protein AVDCRST_MAG06-2029 [uncultured Nocardioides sp.]